MRCAILIPARMASTRFPGKPLCDLGGKPMIQWVYEAANASGIAQEVAIVTPDPEIVSAVENFGGKAIVTRADHVSGTDRLAEAAGSVVADVYVNVQGDEPLISPDTIRACAAPLLRDDSIHMGSVYAPCVGEDVDNPAVVKVVLDLASFALYFSRHPIPFERNNRVDELRKHIGLYAYRRELLLEFAGWSPTPLERAESLEQLRFLEHGVRIKMSPGRGSAVSVDLPEQADEVRKLMAQGWKPDPSGSA
jgi:3-deoxy-manno-octulosonate cytidylyltransferase (CMP-KDO synthetase)